MIHRQTITFARPISRAKSIFGPFKKKLLIFHVYYKFLQHKQLTLINCRANNPIKCVHKTGPEHLPKIFIGNQYMYFSLFFSNENKFGKKLQKKKFNMTVELYFVQKHIS